MVEEWNAKFNLYHVIVTLSNVLCSNVVYTAKVMALTCSILGTYYVLSGHDLSILFTLFFGALSIDALAIYAISCHKCYAIPGDLRRMKELCNMMLNRRNNLMTPREKNIGKHRILAMPNNIGMKDGGFRTLESGSILEFLEFYVNQVISLLLL